MTPARLAYIRKGCGPDMTQARFARALDYGDTEAYARYERGQRPVPTLLGKLAVMIERHGLPTEWDR